MQSKINMDLNLLFDYYDYESKNYQAWIEKCNHWKKKWLFETPANAIDDSKGINPYHLLKKFFHLSPENKVILCSSGSIITNVWHMVNVKKGDKFICKIYKKDDDGNNIRLRNKLKKELKIAHNYVREFLNQKLKRDAEKELDTIQF
jgi:hypothetical protein